MKRGDGIVVAGCSAKYVFACISKRRKRIKSLQLDTFSGAFSHLRDTQCNLGIAQFCIRRLQITLRRLQVSKRVEDIRLRLQFRFFEKKLRPLIVVPRHAHVRRARPAVEERQGSNHTNLRPALPEWRI